MAALAWSASAFAAESRQFGRIESARKLVGREVQTTQNQKVGELKDMVVDLESGRVLYGVISAGGFLGVGDELTAVSPGALTGVGDRLTIDADKAKLTGAPRFTKDHEAKLSDEQFIKQVYQHFGESVAWEGSFNNVHRVSDLIGMNVKNPSAQGVGEVKDLGIDLKAHRVAFAVLGAGGVLGAGEKLYPMPPNAFTLGSDKKSLVTNIDKEKLANAPAFNNDNWQTMANAGFLGRVYQHYGKQPYWDAQLTPTGRDQGRTYEQPDNPRRNTNDDNNGIRARRGQSVRAGAEFANIEQARRLIGMNVVNARSADLGKLTDFVVDLESGRVIYAVVDMKGRGAAKAVAPQSLSLGSDDKSLRFIGDESKLTGAPDFDVKADLHNTEFASRVYTHFNAEQNWFGTSGKFGHVHKASDLLNMKVESSQNQNVGQVQDLTVDLPKGRVLYVILAAGPVLGRGDNLLAIPPNALTAGGDRKTLVTGFDKTMLEGAPRFNRTNLRELANPAKAAEIYRYYGKQAYWNTGEFTPTGRGSGRNQNNNNN